MKRVDQIIVEAYTTYPRPPDQIVSDPEVSADFAARVNSQLSPKECLDVATVNKRLLNLRRRGEDKGGLPRRWRRYNGRNN